MQSRNYIHFQHSTENFKPLLFGENEEECTVIRQNSGQVFVRLNEVHMRL